MRIANLIFPLLALTTACAYGYAGKEGKERTSERRTKPSVTVVTVKESPDEPDDEPEKSVVAKADEPESPCGVRTFQIHYYTNSSHVTKTVDCIARSIVDSQEAAMGEGRYADARSAGLPEGSWYILVDPKGVRGDYLDNANLLQLSRQFRIDYYGRDAGRDLLVYLYNDDPK